MTVAIVTPWHNHPDLWDDYWEAVRYAEPDELIVVDNASEPRLEFATIRLQENLGFCGGSNAGLDRATADVVIFLNNDVQLVRKDWAERLLENLDYGVLVGSRLRTDRHANVDGVTMPYLDGWCLAGMREDLIDLGGWDEDLVEPAYFSDNLLCLEARAQGFTLIEANVGLRHLGGQTSQPKLNPGVAMATNANLARYLDRAREVLASV